MKSLDLNVLLDFRDETFSSLVVFSRSLLKCHRMEFYVIDNRICLTQGLNILDKAHNLFVSISTMNINSSTLQADLNPHQTEALFSMDDIFSNQQSIEPIKQRIIHPWRFFSSPSLFIVDLALLLNLKILF